MRISTTTALLLLCLSIFILPLSAQLATRGGANTFTGTNTFNGIVDAGGSTRTRPSKTGTSLPATCTAGDQYFKSDATAGSNIYGCTATNTWTLESGGGDFSTNTAVSADGEVVEFSGTAGKTGKRSFWGISGPATTLKLWTLPNVAINFAALSGVGVWNGASAPTVVTGTSTNCVHVDGTSAACPGGGTGLTSLNTLTGGTQTFTNDTNVTIVSGGTAHVVTWAGTLAKARQNATTVYTDQANTFSTGAQDFGAASSLKIRVAAGLTAATNGFVGYDSTNNMLHAAQTGADAFIPQFTSVPAANNNCAKWVISGSNYKLGDAGAACSTPYPTTTFSTLTDGATITWAIGSVALANATVTLAGNRTLNITGPLSGGSYALKVIQDGTGSRTLTLGTGCTWKVANAGVGAIVPSTAASSVDLLTFIYDGTSCLATFAKTFN